MFFVICQHTTATPFSAADETSRLDRTDAPRGMTPPPFPAPPFPEEIATTHLLLRRTRVTDAAAVFHGYAQDAEVTRYMVWRPHQRIEDSVAWLQRCDDQWRQGVEYTWAITTPESETLRGVISARPAGHRVEIGYVLARRYWGQGIMTEAARGVVAVALDFPWIHRVWATCDVENLASARVLEKAGMTFEGILRRWLVHPNLSPIPRDARVHARVREA